MFKLLITIMFISINAQAFDYKACKNQSGIVLLNEEIKEVLTEGSFLSHNSRDQKSVFVSFDENKQSNEDISKITIKTKSNKTIEVTEKECETFSVIDLTSL